MQFPNSFTLLIRKILYSRLVCSPRPRYHEPMQPVHPIALTIAGSDSGAGAGIQADLKTFASLRVYGASVLTLVTAQNTQMVSAVHLLPVPLIEQQLDAVLCDFQVGAIKTGALGSAEIIETIASKLQDIQVPLVVDPVMISKHGSPLLAQEAVTALKKCLLPLATVVTPNLHEAAAIAGMPELTCREDMLTAAEGIASTGVKAVVVKGGHSAGTPADLLWTEAESNWIDGERVDTVHTHGTGCTYSSALTVYLLRGFPMVEAAMLAKRYITGALEHGQCFGKGINPVNHFWRHEPEFGRVYPA